MTKLKAIRLVSKQDKSVNWVLPSGQEARYVRRTDDYFIVYLSSHNGCNKSCRFCHLTQTGQTRFKETTVSQYLEQASFVLDHYKKRVSKGLEKPANTVHFNWMARGEPLASGTIKIKWEEITHGLVRLASRAGVQNVKFKISTIMPRDCGLESSPNNLIWFFDTTYKPEFYYSLYSVSDNFRKKWIPKSIDPKQAVETLFEWQEKTNANVVLHWAFIKGQNDSKKDIEDVLKLVKQSGLKTKFNLVRYNPYDKSSSETEFDTVEVNFNKIAEVMQLPGSRIVPRVGLDVSASCGVFVEI